MQRSSKHSFFHISIHQCNNFFILLFIHPSVYSSIHLSTYFIHTFAHPSINLSIHPSISPSIHLSIYLSTYFIHPFFHPFFPSIHLCIHFSHKSIHPTINLSIYSIDPSIHPSIHPPIDPSLHLFICWISLCLFMISYTIVNIYLWFISTLISAVCSRGRSFTSSGDQFRVMYPKSMRAVSRSFSWLH